MAMKRQARYRRGEIPEQANISQVLIELKSNSIKQKRSLEDISESLNILVKLAHDRNEMLRKLSDGLINEDFKTVFVYFIDTLGNVVIMVAIALIPFSIFDPTKTTASTEVLLVVLFYILIGLAFKIIGRNK